MFLVISLIAAIIAGILANIVASLLEKVAGDHPIIKRLDRKEKLVLAFGLFVLFSLPPLYLVFR